MLKSFCEGRLFAEGIGTGPAEVVGLHGWARTREDLIGLLTGFNAVAFDLPGFGASPEPATAWGSMQYAELVAEALTTLGKPQVVLGGGGGRLSWRASCFRAYLFFRGRRRPRRLCPTERSAGPAVTSWCQKT